jgi:hypothetical protein
VRATHPPGSPIINDPTNETENDPMQNTIMPANERQARPLLAPRDIDAGYRYGQIAAAARVLFGSATDHTRTAIDLARQYHHLPDDAQEHLWNIAHGISHVAREDDRDAGSAPHRL